MLFVLKSAAVESAANVVEAIGRNLAHLTLLTEELGFRERDDGVEAEEEGLMDKTELMNIGAKDE